MELAETGLMGNPIKEVTSTISARSLKHIQKLIRSIDDTAFVRIAQVTTVLGRGFDREKVDLLKKT